MNRITTAQLTKETGLTKHQVTQLEKQYTANMPKPWPVPRDENGHRVYTLEWAEWIRGVFDSPRETPQDWSRIYWEHPSPAARRELATVGSSYGDEL